MSMTIEYYRYRMIQVAIHMHSIIFGESRRVFALSWKHQPHQGSMGAIAGRRWEPMRARRVRGCGARHREISVKIHIQCSPSWVTYPWRIHGAGIYTNMTGGILMGSMLPYIAAPWIRHGLSTMDMILCSLTLLHFLLVTDGTAVENPSGHPGWRKKDPLTVLVTQALLYSCPSWSNRQHWIWVAAGMSWQVAHWVCSWGSWWLNDGNETHNLGYNP